MWAERAALAGDVESMKVMGRALIKGDGGRVRDGNHGLAWMVVCASRGDDYCRALINSKKYSGLFSDRVFEIARDIEAKIAEENTGPEEIRCTSDICEI
jgi:hypothetical protein